MPPSLHPQAKFDPIPPDLDLHSLVDRSPNFDWVVRISTAQIRRLGSSGFEKLVQLHVIEGGRPLVIEGWNRVLPDDLFSAAWLEETHDKKQENVRDITSQSDIPMTTGHYLRSMRQLTNQWSPTNYRDERRQRLYLKDIDCPPEWYNHLKKVIPPNVFYMNDNISEVPGADARNDDIFGAPEKTSAVAGDLMSSLDEDMRAQNLMCYIGHEGTFTPAHREMCASLGQNIMVEASGDKNGEKPGSSIWFMTETKDREVVREYFLSMLGHDIEIEKHFAQINAWKKANFPVYVVEQKVGDFILVPPLAPHQVWNRGTRTMKVAWNRTTVETLDLALHEALPKARLVCRDEQYKNKAIIYFTLEKYYKELQSLEESSEVSWLGFGQELMQNSSRTKQMASDFKKLLSLFTGILVDEMFAYKQADVEYVPFDSNITCSYCRSNIFNRFLTCKCCVRLLINGDEDTYDICMECYAMGRSCVCMSGLQWCEQWKWSDLVEKHETWRAMVIKQDGFVDIDLSPQPIEIARKKSGKRSVGQIAQEQLRKRPWNDISKPPEVPVDESEPEPEVDEEGRVKKKPKRKRKLKKGDTHACHVCCHQEYTYKLNFCTTCTQAYCYGVLWRAFDLMPQTAMEQEHWQCPKCLGICNCGSCRRSGNTVPYVPKNTLLGHDTRPIADDRSVESIVDFRANNLNWLKAAGDDNRSKDSKRMQKLRQQADAEKAKDPLATMDADDAPHEMDSAVQDSIMNGYGDQSHIRGQDSGANGHVNGRPSSLQGQDDQDRPGSRVETADMSGIQDGEGDSSYPDPSEYSDPSMGTGRMMGMGFYDQDESADKILFDVFQMPSTDVLNNEPQVSDFVKKTLRLAKRKARLENDDDPDFQGPRSHHRKKPKTGNIDQLVNLDPALLGSLGEPGTSTPTAPSAPDASVAPSSHGGTEGQGQEAEPSEPPEPAPRPKPARLPIDPLRPTLRHAKPMTSYVDAEDLGEDPDDIVPVRISGDGDNGAAAGSEQDPVDLAADAIRALAQFPSGETPVPSKKTATPRSTGTGKRRGRPPRSSLGASTPSAAAKAAKKPGRPAGRPGRPPRRSTLSNVETNGDTTVEDVEDTTMEDADNGENGEDVTVDELEAQLARELGSAQERDEDFQPAPVSSRGGSKKRRGRPPGPRASRSAARVSSEVQPESEQEPVDTEVPEPPQDLSRLSMRERMALKGKKIRIGQRKRPDGQPATPATNAPNATSVSGSRTSTPSRNLDAPKAEPTSKHGRGELLDDAFEPPVAEVSSSSSSESDQGVAAAPPPATKPGGPTVVRLSFSDDDSDSDSGSDISNGDGGPARHFGATRGRGRGRGRGGRMATRGRA
ncbi:Uu.00g064020.m01.CDS01 [Anthostomella pinea]|uniref:Uu.00g064020.m01.CDS01 n=1 Tax=Anthostomella pinea TaxID=933095 RepID=A0AAI8VTG1_9PEZI|nr:Uu.00g064020.m01.CDS01 [Anthostomella pinea]